jgi:thiol:disulfide interchange protein
LVTVLFGAAALNNLATNGVFNFCFFLLLLVFSASLLGGFELTLPNRWINSAEDKTTRKGFGGILMMAAVLALVSFSCTGPIIGTLLVQAATTYSLLAPALGMLGFSLALAAPFVLFALFPGALQRLPRSGAWMNTVKVSLGFIELALSLKFLSNVDLAYHWRWLDREVFLVLWIMITGCFALFLLGKLQINVPKLFLGIVTGAFALYLIPGLWGAPLKSVAAFLPPQATQDFDLYTKNVQVPQTPRKYAALFTAPLGLPAFFDYNEALRYARSVHKPLMIDFTGHACVNCRKMEATVWPDAGVLPIIRDDYVLVQLYVDDKTDSIGSQNSRLQEVKFNSNSQPFYVLENPDTEKPLLAPEGALYDAAAYADYLKKGLKLFKN